MAELSTKDTRRFIHSLRVATGTALAGLRPVAQPFRLRRGAVSCACRTKRRSLPVPRRRAAKRRRPVARPPDAAKRRRRCAYATGAGRGRSADLCAAPGAIVACRGLHARGPIRPQRHVVARARSGRARRSRFVALQRHGDRADAVSARVFVPLVGANGEAQQLFEAIASEEAPAAHPAQLSAQISELFDFGLYGIGQTAREATVQIHRIAPRKTLAEPAECRRAAVALAHFRSSGGTALRRKCALGRTWADPRRRVPSVRPACRSRVCDGRDQAFDRAGRNAGGGRSCRRLARQIGAGRRLSAAAPQGAKRQDRHRRPPCRGRRRAPDERGRGVHAGAS